VLANHFLKKYSPGAGKSIHGVAPAALESLTGYDWPGNVRQLENTIERAVALETTSELHVELPVERAKVRAAAAGADGATTTAMSIPAGAVLPEGVNMEPLCRADRAFPVAIGTGANQRRAGPGRRRARSFLPVRSAT